MNERKGKEGMEGWIGWDGGRRFGRRQWAMLFFYVCLSVSSFQFKFFPSLSVPNVDSILRWGAGMITASCVYLNYRQSRLLVAKRAMEALQR